MLQQNNAIFLLPPDAVHETNVGVVDHVRSRGRANRSCVLLIYALYQKRGRDEVRQIEKK